MTVTSIFCQRPVRAAAHTWCIYGRLGTARIPHVFTAARATWLFDKGNMNLHEVELAIVQTVPDARINKFSEFLKRFEAHVYDKNPARILVLADVTDSPEATPGVWRHVPDAIPIRLAIGVRDDWSFPYRIIGRLGLLSRLQLWINDKKIVSALINNDDDPNVWSWSKVKEALSSTTVKTPRTEDDTLPDDEIAERVVLGVAMMPWWVEAERPDIYEAPPLIRKPTK